MIIKNPRNLPDSIVRAVTGDPDKVLNTDPKRFGVNDLIAPPMIRHLRNKHWGEMEDIVENRVWMMLGSAFHLLMEKYAPPDAVTEEKLEIKIGDYTISGIPDCRYGTTLDDYKVTSVWSYIYGDKPEWEAQLNIYAWMIWKQHGIELDTLQIVALFKNHKEREAEKSSDYPPVPLMIIPIPIWTLDYTEEFIMDRIKAHNELRECSPAEMYQKPTTFAIMQKGRKSALRVLSTMEEAEKWMIDNKGGYIDTRIGENGRCLHYCPVRAFCERAKGEQI